MQYSVVLVLSQSPALCITLIEISLDGGFVSASVEMEGSIDCFLRLCTFCISHCTIDLIELLAIGVLLMVGVIKLDNY